MNDYAKRLRSLAKGVTYAYPSGEILFQPPRTAWLDETADYIDELETKLEHMQATIDVLMWEYCPDDMTKKQKDEWPNIKVPAYMKVMIAKNDDSHFKETLFL